VTDIMADAAAGGGTVKFAYVSPDFANPTGVTLNDVQRGAILDMAAQMDCAVIEDAAYQSLRYRGDDIPPLLAMDIERSGGIENTRTVYLGSFSKTLSPGLRVGWAVAAKPVIQQMVLLKQAGDLQTATLNQIAIADVARRVFDPHIRVLREAYGTRMQAMLAALSRAMPEGVTWTDPDGGMFIWVTLPRGMDAKVVLQNALAAKVAFVPGQAFFADGSNENSLRLNFSLATEDTINTGIERLAGVIADMM
jgi:DNA-binding transcriptional MocR family regulator